MPREKSRDTRNRKMKRSAEEQQPYSLLFSRHFGKARLSFKLSYFVHSGNLLGSSKNTFRSITNTGKNGAGLIRGPVFVEVRVNLLYTLIGFVEYLGRREARKDFAAE